MSRPVNLSSPARKLHVGVILLGSTTEILDVAPIDFLGGISKEFLKWLPSSFVSDEQKEQALDLEIHWVNEKGETAKLTSGLRVQPTDSFATCPKLDIVLMGAHQFDYEPNEAELDFIRKTYNDCSAFLTICGGYEAPLKAGIMEGKTATAPRGFLPQLRKDAPGVNWVEKRWQQDGKLWTSGTLLNGLDLMRGFVEETYSDSDMVKYMLEVGAWPKRNVDFSVGVEN